MVFSYSRLEYPYILIGSFLYFSLSSIHKVESQPFTSEDKAVQEQSVVSPSPLLQISPSIDQPQSTQHMAQESDSSDQTLTITVKQKKESITTVAPHTTHLQDLLTQAGTWSLATGGEASRLEVQIRGGSGAQSGIYLDDIPLHSLRAQAVDLNLFAVDLFDQVQVQAGGNGALQGSGVMSGHVKLRPAKSSNIPKERLKVAGSTQGFATLSTLYQRPLTPQLNATFALSLGGGPNHFPYVDQYGVHKRRLHSDFIRLSGLSQVHLNITEWDISLLAGSGYLNRNEPGPEPFSLPNRYSQQYAHFLSTTIYSPSHLLAKGLLSLKLHASILDLSYYFYEENPLWQSPEEAYTDFRDSRYQVQATLSYERSRLKSSLLMEISKTQASILDINAERIQGAVVPNFQWIITPWLSWSFTYRFDLSTERNLQIIPATTLELNTLERRPWRIWIKWSQVWRDPGFDERYLVGPSLVPNPSLKPEQGDWAELGLSKSMKTTIGHQSLRTRFSLKGYIQRFDQLIMYIPIDPYRLRAENLSGADYLGIEAALRIAYQHSRWKLSLDNHISKLKHMLRAPPYSPLPLRPNLFGMSKGSIRRKLFNGSLEGWIQNTFRHSVTLDLFGERTLPSRYILSVGLSRYWTHQRRYYVTMKVDNLTNQSSYDFALHPIPGRNIWFSIGFN